MKKTLSALLTVLLLFASLSACSTTDDEKSNEPSAPAVSQDASISEESSKQTEESSQAVPSTIVTDEDSSQSYDLSEYSPIGTEGATKIIVRYADVGDTLKDNVFYGNKEVTDIYIEDGITRIDSCAFYECSSLKSVRLPRTLINLGFNDSGKDGFVFYGCNIDELYLPEGITALCESLFSGVHKVLNMPDSIEYFGRSLYFGLGPTEGLKLPKALKRIDKDALSRDIKVWDLPDNIEYIWYLDADKVYVTENSTTHETLKLGMEGGRMWAADYGGEIIFK